MKHLNLSGLFLSLVLTIVMHFPLHAEEGMWLPQLLKQLNEADMRMKGLQLTAADLYNTDSTSLKDAIVLFGGGCTGEIISDRGLLLTNHHCGFGQIQEHSTLEKNYLRDGFWAMEQKDEIPCPGLSVTFIVRIDDVTKEFDAILSDNLSESERNDRIKQKATEIEKKTLQSTGYQSRVRQFFSGNEFYLIVTETFDDVRMVGAPPSSIGKFGGDTDNWMWPRHTGDFSLFRIYANKENKPAAYNSDNQPYVPKKFFPVSLKGVQENDFTMVYGFPGRTQEYISSYAVETLVTVTNPNRIKARDERLRIIGDAMRSSEALHLKYADKQSSISNGWKKMRGESKGLKESNAVQLKRNYEVGFQKWANNNAANSQYKTLLSDFNRLYQQAIPYLYANDFYNEAAFAPEVISFAKEFRKINELLQKNEADKAKKAAEELSKGVPGYFKDYDWATDKQLFSSMLRLFDESVNDSLKPTALVQMRNKYQRNFDKMADIVFERSFLVEENRTKAFLEMTPDKMKSALAKDPGFVIADMLYRYYADAIAPKFSSFSTEISRLNRLYMAAQRSYEPQRAFYPDANSTLRVTYGKVKGYEPRDGVEYFWQTYLDGLMEKYVKGDEEFDLPIRLVELYNKKDYGRYAVNGKLPIAFIATNHTTGGNSGSPVINAKGELIGTNYDRVWEGTMSDVLYNPEICRNVTLDIRYTLWVIDKFANCQRLINELQLVQ
jgi:hypothetical protein